LLPLTPELLNELQLHEHDPANPALAKKLSLIEPILKDHSFVSENNRTGQNTVPVCLSGYHEWNRLSWRLAIGMVFFQQRPLCTNHGIQTRKNGRKKKEA
jgi:hypothetical protein